MGAKSKVYRVALNLLIVFILLISFFMTTGFEAGAFEKHEQPVQLDRQLTQALEKNQYVDVLVKLKEQADTAKVAQSVRQKMKGQQPKAQKLAQNRAVVQSLREVAQQSQKDLISFLNREKQAGRVQSFDTFYVVNAIHIKADRSVIEALAQHPDVTEIKLDELIEIKLPEPKASPLATLSENGVEWNIERIEADQVWEKLGIDGSGAVVGIIDSGVHWQHEALKEKWRGYDPSNPSQPNPTGNWFDAVHGRSLPYDETLLPHGTHVLGIILGQDPAGKNKIGVAPGAQWIAAKAFTANGARLSWLLAAGEFMLAPNGDPSLAPDVVNNSWGLLPTADDWFRDVVRAWRDAGIVPVFAAGNDYGHVANPANYPESIAVGATDRRDKRAPFSNTGPGAYEEAKLKPDMVAPGMFIRSAVPGGYEVMDGTSMATPHVSGVVALLRSADPTLSVDEIVSILGKTATPLVDDQYRSVPNYGYGYGLVNALQAVAAVYTPKGLPVIQEPVNGAYIDQDVITVRGSVPEEGLVTVYVNGRKAATVQSKGRTFETQVTLEKELNVLTATLTVDGQEGEPSVPVTVHKSVEPPWIEMVSPADDMMLTAGDRLTVSFVTERPFTKAELYLVERNRTVGSLSFKEAGAGLYQAEWTVPKNMALSFAEVVVVVEDQAGQRTETVATGTVTVVSDENRMERLSGPNRYATAVEISRSGWREAGTVILARGDHYADALAGVPLAHVYDAPILLTQPNALPNLVLEEIKRLKAARVLILGGEGAVSRQVATQLEKAGLQVERIAGTNRFDTAHQIAQRVAPLGAEHVVLVNGEAYADALSIGAYAAQKQWPILLSSSNQLRVETEAALEALGVEEVSVIGGNKVIRAEVVDSLASKGIKVERIAGANRYETSVKVAEHGRDAFSHLYVTTGKNYADALTGGVLAAKRQTGLMLVEDNRVPEAVHRFVGKYPIMKIDILGGEQAVNKNVEEALKGRLVQY